MSIPAENQKQIFANLSLMGGTFTFRRPASASGTYNVTTSTVTGGSDDDENVIGAFLNYRKADVDGTLIQRNDRLFAMAATIAGAALTKTPEPGDQIRGEGDPVTVIDAQIVKGGSSVIGYLLQVRA